MTFELGKQYIVKVTKNGIIPIEEFKEERFFDKDRDNLDFLTDEEKIIVINDVLDKIRAEIVELDKKVCQQFLIEDVDKEVHHAYQDFLKIIGKYKGRNGGGKDEEN